MLPAQKARLGKTSRTSQSGRVLLYFLFSVALAIILIIFLYSLLKEKEREDESKSDTDRDLPSQDHPFRPLRNIRVNCYFFNTAMQLFFLLNSQSKDYLINSLVDEKIPAYREAHLNSPDRESENKLKGLALLHELYDQIYNQGKSGFSVETMKPFLALIPYGKIRLGSFDDSFLVTLFILELLSDLYLEDPTFSLGYAYHNLDSDGKVLAGSLNHSNFVLAQLGENSPLKKTEGWAGMSQLERFKASLDFSTLARYQKDTSVSKAFVEFKQYLLVLVTELLEVENLADIEEVVITMGEGEERKEQRFRLVYLALCGYSGEVRDNITEANLGHFYGMAEYNGEWFELNDSLIRWNKSRKLRSASNGVRYLMYRKVEDRDVYSGSIEVSE